VLNTVEIKMLFGYDGQECINVYHVEKGSAWTVAQMQAIADAFIAWWNANLKAFMPNTGELSLVTVRDLTTESGLAIERATGLPSLGTNASPQLPNNVTVAVKWSTGFAGRSFRGRTYHVGMPENSTVNNIVSAGPLADLNTAYAALLIVPPTVDATMKLVVVSKFHNLLPRLAGVTTPILARSINHTIDSQRRRLPERGK
jgi:hypothetical protein